MTSFPRSILGAFLRGFVIGLLVWTAFYSISASAESQVPRERCSRAIASLTNSQIMSRQTAIRKARKLCTQIEKSGRYLFRATSDMFITPLRMNALDADGVSCF